MTSDPRGGGVTSGGNDKWGEVLDALAHPYRRQLLVALRQHNPQDDTDTDPLNIVADSEVDSQILETELIHNHLPKLEELGFIEWVPEENRIGKGPRWDEIAPIIGLIENHRDELPEGWL